MNESNARKANPAKAIIKYRVKYFEFIFTNLLMSFFYGIQFKKVRQKDCSFTISYSHFIGPKQTRRDNSALAEIASSGEKYTALNMLNNTKP